MQTEKQYARTATTLFSLSALIVVSILFLNRSIYQYQAEYRLKLRWYEETGSMLGKIRAYRQMSPSLFQGLALSMVFNPSNVSMWVPRPGESGMTMSHFFYELSHFYEPGRANLVIVHHGSLDDSTWTDPLSSYQRRGGTFSSVSENGSVPSIICRHRTLAAGDEIRIQEIQHSTAQFGAKADSILSASKDRHERIKLLNLAATETIRDSLILNSLLKGHRIEDPPINLLASVDDPLRRGSMMHWIAFAELPSWVMSASPYDLSMAELDSKVDFFEKKLWQWGEWDERTRIYNELLVQADVRSIEEVLNKIWDEAAKNLRELRTEMSSMSIPATGVQLRVNDLLMFAGTMLVFFQVLFLIFWTRETAKPSESFSFPDFGGSQTKTARAIAIAQRTIWLVFLLVPVLVLTMGTFLRYDFVSFVSDLQEFNAQPKLDQRFISFKSWRNNDAFAILFDWMNFISLMVSLWVVYSITKKHSKQRSKLGKRISIVTRSVMILPGIYAISALVKTRQDVTLDYFILLLGLVVLFMMIFLLSFGKSRPLTVYSAVMIMAFTKFITY